MPSDRGGRAPLDGARFAQVKALFDAVCDLPEAERIAQLKRQNVDTEIIDEVLLNEEANDHRWVAPAAALQMDLNTPTRILLDAVLKQS